MRNDLRQRYIYVISEGLAGPCKIGIALEVVGRFTGIQNGNPRALTLAYCMPVISAEIRERECHALLRASHIRGEWFAVSQQEAIDVVQQVLEPDRLAIERLRAEDISGFIVSS